MAEQKYKIVRVTMTRDYLVPVEGNRTLNGWSLKTLVEEWFSGGRVNSYHATRDGHRVGNGDQYLSHEIIDL